MNFYCIDWKKNTPINYFEGIRAGAPIIMDGGSILGHATEMYGQAAIDNGEVAVFKIDFPESEQEQFLRFIGEKERRGEEIPDIVCYKKEIPDVWIENVFSVFDYTKAPPN